jgi:L-seryl-tRNA(Ser) seleniumtransferase
VVRIDKVAVAALQAAARDYLFAGDLRARVPVLAQITADLEGLRARADAIAGTLAAAGARHVTVAPDDAAAGGGSFAGTRVASVAVVITCGDEREAVRLARTLRTRPLPIFTRVKGRELRVNMSTIFARDDAALTEALILVLNQPRPAK